jgi:hypothetical protein
MANFTIASLAARAMMDALTTYAGNSGKLRIYNGTVPTNVDTALSGNTQLAELTMNATSFPASTDPGTTARLTANAITSDSSADATGTASFWRLYKSDGTTQVLQGNAGTSAAELILNTTSITLGSTVSVTSFTIDLPKGP